LNTVLHSPIVGSVKTVVWNNEADCEHFARTLAAQPALRNAFIELQGDLGAGKTTLVRHLLRALGVQGRVKSPTYAVVEPYELQGFNAWHFDFYRFADPREWEEAGFRDIFASPGLKLVEWPDKARAQLPVCDVAIKIVAIDDSTRQVTLTSATATGNALIANY
jgi:tRNA threonylcarbamoyladenosine biosynthesis protein TsaE